jgi:exodeoxyribonuclease VII small subunit
MPQKTEFEGQKIGDHFERLEELLAELSDPERSMDDRITLFEEGVGRVRAVRADIEAAELRIEQLIESEAGDLVVGDAALGREGSGSGH